jgi:deoxyribodipyrimidine photo-lyase
MGSPAGPRRIVLWFRNDLRLRDNAIVHTAVQKLQAKEFDEVRHMAAAGGWIN